MPTFEMLWDCEPCGTRGLLGKTHRRCPNCGSPQDPTRRYFPPPGQEAAVANYTFHGVDKACPSCQTPNGAKSNNCCSCGAPLDGSRNVSLIAEGTLAPSKPQQHRPQALVSVPRKPRRALLIGCLVPLLFFTLCVVIVTWEKDVTATVTRHSWHRSIEIERFGPVAASSWCDSMPSGAYNVSRRREQNGTKSIPDGEECSTRNVDNGDGTFSQMEECRTTYRSEPVYEDKCYYTVDRWTVDRTLTASGSSLEPPPAWPEVQLARSGNCVGCEREARRKESYYLSVRFEDDVSQCEVAPRLWARFKDGEQVAMKATVIDGKPSCSSLPKR